MYSLPSLRFCKEKYRHINIYQIYFLAASKPRNIKLTRGLGRRDKKNKKKTRSTLTLWIRLWSQIFICIVAMFIIIIITLITIIIIMIIISATLYLLFHHHRSPLANEFQSNCQTLTAQSLADTIHWNKSAISILMIHIDQWSELCVKTLQWLALRCLG